MVLPDEPSIGTLARRVQRLRGTTHCTDVERILVRSDAAGSLVGENELGELFLVDRVSFLHLMAGPIGFGRTLHAEHEVQRVIDRSATFILPSDTPVQSAFEALLKRPQRYRFQDIVVTYPDGGVGLLESTVLLERVAALNAEEALRDPLTGLGNRTMLTKALDRRLSHANAWLALLFVDLDRFKVVNDGLGHEAGDRLLQVIAERIRRVVGNRGSATRLGGDEFAILLEASSLEIVRDLAVTTATNVRQAIRAQVSLGDRHVITSASIGVALSGPGSDSAILLRQADISMYQAKRAGGDQHRIFTGEQAAEAQEQLDMEIWLRHSLDAGGLEVAYQPMVELGSRRLLGFESLVRGVHPELGSLSPGAFLPLAAEIGLLPQIDAWVLRQALRQCRRWRAQGADHLALSVNLSAQTLSRPDTLRDMQLALVQSQVPAANLIAEVTEHEALADLSATTDLLHGLRALGVRIAIDDFGTGYSSLGQLASLPLDILKVDQTFIARMEDSSRDREMVGIILSLARGMRARAIAEGIERESHSLTLQAMGCEAGQGYLFSRPLTGAQADDLVARSLVSAAA